MEKGYRNRNKIGIIGAGASGLAAAVAASEDSPFRVFLYEKNAEPGKKILATGNGRCNITNEFDEDYLLCKRFFHDLGILLAEGGEGRMYPHSKRAVSVRDALAGQAAKNGAKLITETNIADIRTDDGGFSVIDSEGSKQYFEKLIIATGGKAGIQYGSSGDGLKFARGLGLDVKPVMPGLVPMTYSGNPSFDVRRLKGVRADVGLKLTMEGYGEVSESGEVQFTDYGLSGICVFNLSRYLRNAQRSDSKIVNAQVIIDFVPTYTEEELTALFRRDLQAGLKGVVNEKVEEVFLKGGLDPKQSPVETAGVLKAFPVRIDGTKGWKEAQVTLGGVGLDQINMNTMESTKVRNLFFAGEVLDYDGPCGGHNLSWAWKTGIRAGKAAAGAGIDDQTI